MNSARNSMSPPGTTSRPPPPPAFSIAGALAATADCQADSVDASPPSRRMAVPK
jgi:hypothetical protein